MITSYWEFIKVNKNFNVGCLFNCRTVRLLSPLVRSVREENLI